MNKIKIWSKHMIKDFRRIRWPKSKSITRYFINTIIFIAITVALLFAIDYAFTSLWTVLGVGING